MTKYLTAIVFVLFVLKVGYTQNTRSVIKNKRTKTIGIIESKQYDAIDLTYDYGNGIAYLSKTEQEMILLFQRKFEVLPARIMEHEKDFHKDGMFRIQSNLETEHPQLERVSSVNDTLSRTIVRQFLSEKEVLLFEIARSEIAEEAKLFLIYYVNFLAYQFDICDRAKQEKVIASAKQLAEEYPKSSYLLVPRKYNDRNRTIPYSFGGSMGFSGSVLTNGLSEHLNERLSTFLTLEYRWKNLEVSTQLSYLNQKVTQDFEGIYAPFNKGRGTRFSSLGLAIGYVIPLVRSFEVTPFIGYKNTDFNGVYFNKEDRDTINFRRVKGSNFFAGANFDLFLFKDDCQSRKEEKRYFGSGFFNVGLRFQLGLLSPNLQKSLTPLTGNVFYFGLGIVTNSNGYTGKRIKY